MGQDGDSHREEPGRGARDLKIVALDKTGTLTRNEPRVTRVVPAEAIEKADVLRTAAGLESRSEHRLRRNE